MNDVVAKPLTEKALAKLCEIVTGNGVDPKKVELVDSEETELTLHADMELRPDIKREQKRYMGAFVGNPKKTGNITALQTAQQLEGAVNQIKQHFTSGDDWIKKAQDELKAEAGQGWGLEEADVALEEMTQVFFVTEMCPDCQGQGGKGCTNCYGSGLLACQRCQSSGRELCYACNGSGIYNNDATTYCPVCKGATMAVCRVCQGLRQVNCPQCAGKGKTVCPTCKGDGKATLEEKVTPIVQCVFVVHRAEHLPSGFRRAISRSGGLQSLARGHATITMGEPNEQNPERITIPYTAKLPYADVRVRAGGRAMLITVMGLKHAILDVPPFLDAKLEPEIAAMEANPSKTDLTQAFKWRVLRDAFDGMQKGEDIKALRRKYPFGFSVGMLERARVIMTKIVQGNTLTNRLMAGGAFLAGLALIDWIALTSYTRGAMAEKISPMAVIAFDIIVCIAMAFGGQRLLQYVSLQRLKKLLGADAVGKMGAQKTDFFDLAIMLAAILLYLGMIALLNAPPNWFGPISK